MNGGIRTLLPAKPGPSTTIERRRVVALALAASGVAVLPLLTSRHLPILDAPAHEARLAVLRDLVITGHGSPFYRLQSFFVPDIAFDVAGLGLIRWLAPETIGKIFFGLTLVLTLWGVLALNRAAIGRWSAMPLAASLLLFNLVFVLGFFSYDFGLALVPWALAGRLKLERAPPIVGFVLGTVFSLVLLFCHVADFGIYAAMAAGFALTALIQHRHGFAAACLRLLELVPAVGLFLSMSASRDHTIEYPANFLSAKLYAIAKSITAASLEADIAFGVGALSLILLIAMSSRPRVAISMVPGLIALCLLYVAMPLKLGSGGYVDIRLPIAIAFLVLAGLDIRPRRGAASVALTGLLVAAIVVKQASIAVLWRSFDDQIDSVAAALDTLPNGSIIMQAECQPESAGTMAIYRERQPSMTHLSAMAGFGDRRFVAANWAIAGQQPIDVMPEFLPYYDLQATFSFSSCTARQYRAELAQIRNLAEPAGSPAAPLYFLLIRPPLPNTLSSDAMLVAAGRGFELYALAKR